MNRDFLFVLATAALAAPLTIAQSQPTAYATVRFHKNKPGMAAELLKHQREIADHGAAAVVGSGGAEGFVRLTMVFPSPAQVGHDMLCFYVSSKKPLIPAGGSPAFLQAIGMTREEWDAKRMALDETERQEVWTNVFRHGSLEKGDIVKLSFVNPPMGKTADYLDVMGEYESGVQAQYVQDGRLRSAGLWRLWNAREDAAYNFVRFEVYKDAAGLAAGLGNRQEVFRKAHPWKDYLRYVLHYDAVSSASTFGVYRVDAAIWKSQ